MKAIIVQGPGYFGVNIRIVTDEAAVKVLDQLGHINEVTEGGPVGGSYGESYVIVAPVPKAACCEDGCNAGGCSSPESFGFDTGWWGEAEKVMENPPDMTYVAFYEFENPGFGYEFPSNKDGVVNRDELCEHARKQFDACQSGTIDGHAVRLVKVVEISEGCPLPYGRSSAGIGRSCDEPAQ